MTLDGCFTRFSLAIANNNLLHQKWFLNMACLSMLAASWMAISPLAIAQTTASERDLVVEASTSLEWDQKKGQYKAVGNASAEQGSQRIDADILTATYDLNSDSQDIIRIIGEGNVRFIDQQQQGQGQKLDYNKTEESYLLNGPNANISGPDGNASAQQSIFYEKSDNKITLKDNAMIVLNDGRELAGDFVTVSLDDQQNVTTINAEGNVVVKQPNGQVATSDKADYDKLANTALFLGNVVISEKDSVLTGERAEIDFTSGISRMLSPTQGKRISGRFTTSQN